MTNIQLYLLLIYSQTQSLQQHFASTTSTVFKNDCS